MKNDLLHDAPLKSILLFALPIYMGQLFTQAYGLCDTLLVGHLLGSASLAAVSATTALSDLLLEFLGGIIAGFGVIVARHFGANDQEKMQKAIGGTITLSLGFSLLLSVACLLFLPQLLDLMQISPELHHEAAAYIGIIIAGLAASSCYQICAALCRAVGDSFTPLLFLIFSNVLNVLLDVIAIRVFHLGVMGSALATVLTQALSALLCYLYMLRKHPLLKPASSTFKPTISVCRQLLPNGLSMGFMLSFVLLGSLALQTTINALGANIIVAHTGTRKLTIFLLLPFFSLGTALATYCSQNIGADRTDRVRSGLRSTIALCAAWCGIALIVTYAFAPAALRFLTATDEPEIIENAELYLRINVPFFLLPALICIFRNSLQGLNDTLTPLISSVIELAGKVLIALYLVPAIGYMGVIVSEPIVWVLMVIPLLVRLLRHPALVAEKR